MIIYYAGHAESSGGSTVGYQDRKANRRGIRQFAPKVQLLDIQSYLQRACTADVLVVFDCCTHKDNPNLLDLSLPHTLVSQPHASEVPEQIVETLAARTDDQCIRTSPPHRLAWRLTGQLILLSQSEGMSVDQLNTVLFHDWWYRNCEFECSWSHGGENARMLNCGQGSIFLQRMPNRPKRKFEILE